MNTKPNETNTKKITFSAAFNKDQMCNISKYTVDNSQALMELPRSATQVNTLATPYDKSHNSTNIRTTAGACRSEKIRLKPFVDMIFQNHP